MILGKGSALQLFGGNESDSTKKLPCGASSQLLRNVLRHGVVA